MRLRSSWLILLLGLVPGAAGAVLNTHDARPAATLLLPYFEVDPIPNFPEAPGGLAGVRKAVLTIGNGGAAPLRVRVNLWTDFGIPTLSFHVALTGYDMETIDLKQTFDGIVPPGGFVDDAICTTGDGMRLPPGDIIGLRNAHSGQPSSLFGNLCGSWDFGDGALRGFVTVDVVTACDDTLRPNQADYATILGDTNALWGFADFWDPGQNATDAGNLVHIEAGSFAPSDYTFYGRFNGFSGADNREALGNVWAVRFINGGAFDGTTLRVWREPRSVPVPVACPVAALPASQPGDAHEIIAFDESEDAVSLSTGQPLLPLATQGIRVGTASFPLPFNFGWLLLNLNSAAGVTKDELKQSYVSAVGTAPGRFAASADAFRLSHPSGSHPNDSVGAPPVFPGMTAVDALRHGSGGGAP
jgi:hypothetical protein